MASSSNSSALVISLLGDFQVRAGAEELSGFSTRLQALLAYLLLNRHAPQPRQHLAFLFWPDTTEKQAHTNLRNLVFLLRQALPHAEQYVEITTTTVRWRPDAPYQLDVAQFEEAVAAARAAPSAAAAEAALEQAAAHYPGDLLPKFYDEWLVNERARLCDLYMDVLDQLAARAAARRDYRPAISYAQRLLRADPLREESYRTLMQLHAANQERAAALHVYHTCARTLARELEVAPSDATQALYHEILEQTALPPTESLPAAPAVQPGFVGRATEQQTLRRVWARAVQGEPQLVLLQGEAGIGKTRLAEELLAEVARTGVITGRARAYATSGALAYAPLVEWLQLPAISAGLRRLAPVWRSELMRLLPEIAAAYPDTPPPEPLSAGWQRQRLFEAITHLLLALEQPLLLLLDDLQWADAETLDYLHALLMRQASAPLLVVAAARSEALDEEHPLYAWHAALARHDRVLDIELGPLSFAETVDLGEAVAARTLDAATAASLYAETEGYPLFIVEAIHAGFGAQSGPPPDGSPWRKEDSTLPAAVRAVIQTRLAQLAPATRALLGVAAVTGREFTYEVLVRAGELDEPGVIRCLDELWRRRMIREQGAHTYDFVHDKVREVAYAALGPIQRKHLHCQVAAALQEVNGGQTRSLASQLAFHYARGGEAHRALAYYEEAAEVAQQIHANAEAIRHYRSALRLWPAAQGEPVATQVRLCEKLGDLLQMDGQAEAARAAFDQALGQADPGALLERSRLLRKLGKTWEYQYDYAQACCLYDQAEQMLAPVAPNQAYWQAWLQIQLERLWVHYWLNQWVEADELARQTAPVVDEQGSALQQISFYLALSTLSLRRHRYAPSPGAVAWARRGWAVAQSLADPGQIAWAGFILGFALLWGDEAAEAAQQLAAALQSAQERGDVVHQARCLTYLTLAHRRQGEDAATAQLAQQSLEAAETAHTPEYVATAHANLAWVAWRRGDRRWARAQAEQALALWHQLPPQHSSCAFQWTALWPHLAVALAGRDLEAALADARALLDPLQQRLPDALAKTLQEAVAAWESHAPGQAETRLHAALDWARQEGYL